MSSNQDRNHPKALKDNRNEKQSDRRKSKPKGHGSKEGRRVPNESPDDMPSEDKNKPKKSKKKIKRRKKKDKDYKDLFIGHDYIAPYDLYKWQREQQLKKAKAAAQADPKSGEVKTAEAEKRRKAPKPKPKPIGNDKTITVEKQPTSSEQPTTEEKLTSVEVSDNGGTTPTGTTPTGTTPTGTTPTSTSRTKNKPPTGEMSPDQVSLEKEDDDQKRQKKPGKDDPRAKKPVKPVYVPDKVDEDKVISAQKRKKPKHPKDKKKLIKLVTTIQRKDPLKLPRIKYANRYATPTMDDVKSDFGDDDVPNKDREESPPSSGRKNEKIEKALEEIQRNAPLEAENEQKPPKPNKMQKTHRLGEVGCDPEDRTATPVTPPNATTPESCHKTCTSSGSYTTTTPSSTGFTSSMTPTSVSVTSESGSRSPLTPEGGIPSQYIPPSPTTMDQKSATTLSTGYQCKCSATTPPDTLQYGAPLGAPQRRTSPHGTTVQPGTSPHGTSPHDPQQHGTHPHESSSSSDQKSPMVTHSQNSLVEFKKDQKPLKPLKQLTKEDSKPTPQVMKAPVPPSPQHPDEGENDPDEPHE
ncbi:unnamed protein product [Bursaphelenchus okinawaensis]|uniref:Uncharacterized protein n=1 Tax=Bursaphelenchus okinawaensis TaxID=465554 RepID=A0A811KG42_9BILA|nr:unnamed protein product [Bursaphelenchus okinawaensis]CAG9101608.1 unnamed protein product [Bursaphelenchus okinawaensis]